jgi:hypothetical protein
LGESFGHLARSIMAGLTEANEHGVTVVISVRLKAVMAIAVELNAFIFKECNCLINIIVWGMRTEFR